MIPVTLIVGPWLIGLLALAWPMVHALAHADGDPDGETWVAAVVITAIVVPFWPVLAVLALPVALSYRVHRGRWPQIPTPARKAAR